MVLISIVGDFHSSILPVFYNFKDKITKHLLVYDDAKKDVQHAQDIQNGIKNFSKKYNLTYKMLNYKVDEDSLDALKKCAEYILALSNKPNEIYINTTDGYSTLTTILNHKLFKKNVNFIAYDMYDNEYNILNKNGLEKTKILHNLNIQDHFLLKGYKTKSSTIKSFANQHNKEIKQIFETYSESYNTFIKLNEMYYKTVNSISNDLEIKPILLSMNLDDFHIKNPLLTGGLFECYVYLLLKEMNYDDIDIGLEVFRKYKNSEIKNEFDIIVMKDNHLHIIECKFKKTLKIEELVYKYIALGNMLDEDGKIAIVMKNKPLYNQEIEDSRHKGLSFKRGKLSNISIFGNVHKESTVFKMNIQNLFKV